MAPLVVTMLAAIKPPKITPKVVAAAPPIIKAPNTDMPTHPPVAFTLMHTSLFY